jgi:hypothetical protein
MSNDNQLSKLLDQLSRGSSSNLQMTKFMDAIAPTRRTASIRANDVLGISMLGLSSRSDMTAEKTLGVRFGKPPSTEQSSSTGGGALTNLLSHASAGIGSALEGGLSSFAGLGGLVSDIAKLFGGSSKAAPPPLALFSLPESIQQTFYVTENRSGSQAGKEVSEGALSNGQSALYTSGGLTSNASGASSLAQTDSSAIAQAVKNALLTSSSLSDIIAEI